MHSANNASPDKGPGAPSANTALGLNARQISATSSPSVQADVGDEGVYSPSGDDSPAARQVITVTGPEGVGHNA